MKTLARISFFVGMAALTFSACESKKAEGTSETTTGAEADPEMTSDSLGASNAADSASGSSHEKSDEN